MDMARFVIEAHLSQGRPVAEIAGTHGISKSWIYELISRYRAEGEIGLVPRSRRPRHCPTQTPIEVEEEIILIRKTLSDDGFDAGPQTIHYHLQKKFPGAVSETTIARILRRRGFITPQPKKRPKSSYIRFEADLPNECWQSDFTHWSLADGTDVEILNFLDDHSRMILASVVCQPVRAKDVVEVFHQAADTHGLPASVLTDNGCVYTTRYRGGKVAMETELESLGIVYKHSTPYHPQTQGKVERFHQTLKKHLAKQPRAGTIAELQSQIDHFVEYYNCVRPHRGIGRRTPIKAFEARIKAHPPTPSPPTHYRIRHDKVDTAGKVSLRYKTKLLHLAVGRPHKNQRVKLLIADRDVSVINDDGELLAEFRLDPTRQYQPRIL